MTRAGVVCPWCLVSVAVYRDGRWHDHQRVGRRGTRRCGGAGKHVFEPATRRQTRKVYR